MSPFQNGKRKSVRKISLASHFLSTKSRERKVAQLPFFVPASIFFFFPSLLHSRPNVSRHEKKRRRYRREEGLLSFLWCTHNRKGEKKKSLAPCANPPRCLPSSLRSILGNETLFLVHSERRRRRRQMHSGGNEIDPWPDKSVRMFSQLSELDFLLFCPYQKSLLISRPFIARPFVIRRNNDRGRK